jgi:hypothetical protein
MRLSNLLPVVFLGIATAHKINLANGPVIVKSFNSYPTNLTTNR